MYKSMVSVLTAQNATETTKTLVDTLVVPQGVKALVGVGSQISPAGLTSLEDTSYILELESDDMSPWGGTQQFLGLALQTVVTSGAVALNPYIHPVNIPVTAGAHIKVSATFNKAQTVNPSVRAQLVFE
jgi:hypothetical protein